MFARSLWAQCLTTFSVGHNNCHQLFYIMSNEIHHIIMLIMIWQIKINCECNANVLTKCKKCANPFVPWCVSVFLLLFSLVFFYFSAAELCQAFSYAP